MKSLYSVITRVIRGMDGAPEIAGMEIGDRSIRLVRLGADGAVTARGEVQLAPGVVEDGKVGDISALASALYGLRAVIGAGKKSAVPVIVSVSPALVYAQAFSLPYLIGEAREEAALLNLRVISPIDIDEAYADWQEVAHGGEDSARQDVRALGAFAERQVIDAYMKAVSQAGFMPVAVEFASLSVARAIMEGLDPALRAEPAIAIGMTEGGIMFFIMDGGVPYFTRFMSWGAVRGDSAAGAGGVTIDRLKEVAGMELRRLLDFYRSKWKGSIGRAFVMNAASNADIATWVKAEFSLEVFAVGGYQGTDRSYMAASGAALRGRIPRSQDRLISLAPAGTEEQYFQSRIAGFVSLWRRVSWGATFGVALAMLMLDFVAARVEQGALRRAEGGEGQVAGAVRELEERAAAFNAHAAKAKKAADMAARVSGGIGAIVGAERSGVKVTGIRAENGTRSATITGTADTEQGAVAFKGRVADNPLIERIDMPLSAIVSAPGQKVSFSATVTFK